MLEINFIQNIRLKGLLEREIKDNKEFLKDHRMCLEQCIIDIYEKEIEDDEEILKILTKRNGGRE